MTSFKTATISLAALILATSAQAADPARPWMNTKLTPDERARLLDEALTLDERIGLLHGPMAMPVLNFTKPEGAIGSAGYFPGVPRLGLPALQETDASLGVTNPLGMRPGDGATALPASLALAATFDPKLAFAGGAVVGAEARAKGFNILLGGGVNLARDARGGRNFEYVGEDPLLAGVMAGEAIRGAQSQDIVSTVKHFAVNGQETGRNFANSVIDEAAARESDLLAFQIAIERGQPGSVMCAYNLVNGAYSCGSDHLLNGVLKRDWGYKGWVMSDWGAVYEPGYALKGLDQQSGEQLDPEIYFGARLKAEVESGQIPAARVSDMSRRILRSLFATGVIDKPVSPGGAIDYAAHAQVAKTVALDATVLLKNQGGVLPLRADLKTILVVGGHADAGVLSGGGSSQVVAPDKPTVAIALGGDGMMAQFRKMHFHPSSPLDAIRASAPGAQVTYDDGRYPQAAAARAKAADVVIVFANQWMGEGEDAPDLSLPDGQDALIAALTAANPKTVVVLQTGGAVTMPWLDQSAAVLEAWYSGARGGEAIADLLFGKANPSGRLPITFPASLDQYPRVVLPGLTAAPKTRFDVVYDEGADIGYRRLAKTGAKPLFPFGYGLSYTTFAYEGLSAKAGGELVLAATVRNTGERQGATVAQVYLVEAAGKPVKRLVGFAKVDLRPGEERRVSLTVDPRLLADFDAKAGRWRVSGGAYRFALGASSADLGAPISAKLKAATLAP
jgi:beta-glucosidase